MVRARASQQALAVPATPLRVDGPSGFDPSRIEVLSLGYADPPVGCTRARWYEVFKPFCKQANYHAANLAAHDWDVLLVGGRVFLFQTRYGGDKGHWLSHDGSREDASAREQACLYTPAKRRRFASGMGARQGGNEVPPRSGGSPAPKGNAQGQQP
jgi:hypothetical protein